MKEKICKILNDSQERNFSVEDGIRELKLLIAPDDQEKVYLIYFINFFHVQKHTYL